MNVTSRSCAVQGPPPHAMGQAPFKAEKAQMCVHMGGVGRGAWEHSGTPRTLIMVPEWAVEGFGASRTGLIKLCHPAPPFPAH